MFDKKIKLIRYVVLNRNDGLNYNGRKFSHTHTIKIYGILNLRLLDGLEILGVLYLNSNNNNTQFFTLILRGQSRSTISNRKHLHVISNYQLPLIWIYIKNYKSCTNKECWQRYSNTNRTTCNTKTLLIKPTVVEKLSETIEIRSWWTILKFIKWIGTQKTDNHWRLYNWNIISLFYIYTYAWLCCEELFCCQWE